MARAAGDDLTDTSPRLAQRVGGRIRERRTALGQTLAQTAREAKISVSHLSSIETGLTLPSLPILARIAPAIGLTLNEVLSDVGGGSAIRHEHLGEAVGARQLSHHDLQLEICALVVEPGEKSLPPFDPDGAELFVYVCAGSLEVSVGEIVTELNTGDSLDTDEASDVSWRAVGELRSVSIWVRGPQRDLA